MRVRILNVVSDLPNFKPSVLVYVYTDKVFINHLRRLLYERHKLAQLLRCLVYSKPHFFKLLKVAESWRFSNWFIHRFIQGFIFLWCSLSCLLYLPSSLVQGHVLTSFVGFLSIIWLSIKFPISPKSFEVWFILISPHSFFSRYQLLYQSAPLMSTKISLRFLLKFPSCLGCLTRIVDFLLRCLCLGWPLAASSWNVSELEYFLFFHIYSIDSLGLYIS